MEDRESVRVDVMRLLDSGYSEDARKLMARQCGTTDSEFFSQIAVWYLDQGDLVFFHPYEYYCRAYALVPRGLSAEIRERMLRAFVKVGFHHHAEQLATGLGRLLDLSEILTLVACYTKGSVQSDATEKALRALAWDTGGELLEGIVRRDIATMHDRWRSQGFLR